MKRKYLKRVILSIFVGIGIATIAIGVLINLYNKGIVIPNELVASKYPIKGIDVSNYQGDIDWEVLSNEEDISFVFIKATEGSSFVDKKFKYNYEQARKNGLYVGAYHFFSYDSEGKTQAENFIKTVKAFNGMLPPVIDLEFYGDKMKNPPKKKDVDTQLKVLLEKLENHYGKKPIIYASEISYALYLANDYEEYDIWISNFATKPIMWGDNKKWTFWQYADREKLDGYSGDEKFIDVNVFYGSEEEFNKYIE